jgi:hypothetical protein
MDSTKVKQFWDWFAANSARLSKFETDQASLTRELTDALRRIHQPAGYSGRGPSLGFDIGPRRDGVREFVISADAIPSAFHLARELVKGAPALKGWNFAALIPRRKTEQVLAQCGIDKDDVWFKADRAGDRFNINVFVRNISTSEMDISEVRSFLIYILGEETFGVRVSGFDCQRLPPDPAAWGLRPLRDLPEWVDNESLPSRVNGAA